MGNITLSLEDKGEEKARRIAKKKFGGKKGALSRVFSEGIRKLEGDEKRERSRKKLLEIMEKGYPMGKILYKHRSELYER